MLPLGEPGARAPVPMAFGLGTVLGLELAVESLAKDHFFAAETVSVVAAPIILAAALLLWRLAGILCGGAEPESVPGGARGGEFVRLLTRLMQMSAIVLAGAVASGYIALAREIADSVVLTVASRPWPSTVA